jgi:hypothetical protein
MKTNFHHAVIPVFSNVKTNELHHDIRQGRPRTEHGHQAESLSISCFLEKMRKKFYNGCNLIYVFGISKPINGPDTQPPRSTCMVYRLRKCRDRATSLEFILSMVYQ